VFAASLAAATLAGWGWAMVALPAQDMGAHAAAVVLGQAGAIGLLVATSFALPTRWRTGSRIGPLITGQAGAMLIAVSAGLAVALAAPAGSGPARVIAPGVIGVLGVALLLTAALAHVRSGRRAAARDDMVRTGQQAPGLITEAAQTGMMNNVPRWRVVVRFTDSSGDRALGHQAHDDLEPAQRQPAGRRVLRPVPAGRPAAHRGVLVVPAGGQVSRAG